VTFVFDSLYEHYVWHCPVFETRLVYTAFYETAHFLRLVKNDVVKNIILRPFIIQTEDLMMEKESQLPKRRL